MHELILGGHKSGKSALAESRAAAWLARGGGREAVLIATALGADAEMRRRIARHRAERARRVPGLLTLEEPLHLARAIQQTSRTHRLVVVDCLTLWLTHWRLPPPMLQGCSRPGAGADRLAQAALLEAVDRAMGPLVLVGNEIGLGVMPLGEETRAFCDALGQLHQALASRCARVTLMVAGQPLAVKGPAR